MTFQSKLENSGIEKHTLAVMRLRKRVTGWEVHSGNIYYVDFDLGYVTRVWDQYNNDDGLILAGSPPGTSGRYYYDHSIGRVYANISGERIDPDPDTAEDGFAVGLTIEYEVYLSDTVFTGPRDPLDETSDVVDWQPAIEKEPVPVNGSRDQLYGFSPLQQTSIGIRNDDGWLNEHIYESSFYLGPIKIYTMVGSDYERAVEDDEINCVFSGFTDGLSIKDSLVSVNIVDLFKQMDRPFKPKYRFTIANFGVSDFMPGAEGDVTGNEDGWYVREVYGRVENFLPVCIDYDEASPSTSNNRTWITHQDDGTVATVGYNIDDGAANTNTTTFVTSAPNIAIGDHITTIQAVGGDAYAKVTAINGLEITHTDLGYGGRTVTAGDTIIRAFVPSVYIEVSPGFVYQLGYGIHYSLSQDYTSDGKNIRAIILDNNFEAALSGFPATFDPGEHTLFCTVYGRADLPTYSDTTSVGTVSSDGSASLSVSILYRVLERAGFTKAQINKSTFADIGAGSHRLGFAVPSTRAGSPPSFLDVVTNILQSMIWRLGYIQDSGDVKISLSDMQPITTQDFDITESDSVNLGYDQDYSDIYSEVLYRYNLKEFLPDGENNIEILTVNQRARDLYFVDNRFELNLLQCDSDADETARRYLFVLSERRGTFSMALIQDLIISARLGSSAKIFRQSLPGFPYVYGTEVSRVGQVIEVRKSSSGATVLIDEQKGVQDNAGVW